MNEIVALFEQKAGFLVGRTIDGHLSNLRIDWRDEKQGDPRATLVAWKVEIVKECKKHTYVRLIEPDIKSVAAKYPAAAAFLCKEGRVGGTKLPTRLAPWKDALNKGDLSVLAKLERILQPAFSYELLNCMKANELVASFAAGRK